MAGIMLVGTSGIQAIPFEVHSWIEQYNNAGHKFIVGDNKSADGAIHRALSSVGATENSTIYCMDNPNFNGYDLKVRRFLTSYDSEKKEVYINCDGEETEAYVISDVIKVEDISITRQWYEYRDRQMIADCDIGIFIIAEESKKITNMIQIMNIMNKPCYVFRV